MYNNVKHVRMSNAKIKGLYLIDFLINHLNNQWRVCQMLKLKGLYLILISLI